ncbi:hypothetical protein AGOR_G00216840 [Albula goreensis]|uniref:E3 ubiquitin ligase TRAF3IP2 n=1 Tax=Albula goreensis TaxID=1534307 RepID=A0A8T3CJ39_9TELE|nr:hypothetical protein AGOR_G00216840 [Albula goreensis]
MRYANLPYESLNCPEENDETVSGDSLSSTRSDLCPSPPSLRGPCTPSSPASRLSGMADGHLYDPCEPRDPCAPVRSSFGPYQPSLGLPSGYSPPAPFPSWADGCPSCHQPHKRTWPSPSFASSYYGGGYSNSLPFCPPPSEYPSYLGQDSYPYSEPHSRNPSNSSLEMPRSLRSIQPSPGIHNYYLPPYHCTPQGPACCAKCPVEGFRTGPLPQHNPRPGYHLPYRHPGPVHCGCPDTGSTQSEKPHAQPGHNTVPCRAPLSLEQRKVFVTYEADNEKHVNEIIKFVALLRHNGFDMRIDVFEQQFSSISKIDFMEKFINEKGYLIIIAISPKYHETVTGALVSLEKDERTLNTVYIHKQLQNEFIQNGCRNFRFIPILFPGAKKCHVPTWLQNTHVYSWPKDQDDILRRLMRVEKYNPPPIGDLPTIVSIPL